MKTIEEILEEFTENRLKEAKRIARQEAAYLKLHLMRARNNRENLEEAYREWLFD